MFKAIDNLIPGSKVNMGGHDFTIPPLNFKRLKALHDELELLKAIDLAAGGLTAHQLEASITIIHTALTRNYPEITRDEVEELLDMGNLANVMAAIMGQSGLVKRQGE